MFTSVIASPAEPDEAISLKSTSVGVQEMAPPGAAGILHVLPQRGKEKMRVHNFSTVACAFFFWGCDNINPTRSSNDSSPGEKMTARSAIVLDNAGNPKACDGPADASCNAQGPGQRLACDPDGACRLYLDADTCVADEDSTVLSCAYTSCGNDGECSAASPDPDNLVSTCTFTQATFDPEGLGICTHFWGDCEILADTPCHAIGVTFCENGECTCTAEANMDAASGEVCDGVDNDCDGDIDEGFDVGAACDGDDADLCENGTYTCTESGLGVECVNEEVEDVAEACNGLDDDCDGDVDEDFPTLGEACDDGDADLCENGVFVCNDDGSGVECAEVGMNIVEICNGLDDDCDGQVDEGCDDDADGWCDSDMLVAAGAMCVSGDCDDADADIHPQAEELCNGDDDNCVGGIDEGFGLGDACTDGQGVCERQGTYSACAEDGLSALCDAQADPDSALNVEVCNGQDDTCDGQIDEDCDDDEDGWCDSALAVGQDAACAAGDCDDANADINADATEVCDDADNNCDGQVDEGCDDDADGWCDSEMDVVAGATCNAGDCDDADGNVHPDMEEQCITLHDDNCDGDTEHLADGVTPACDSCANALELPCGEDVVIDMGTEPNAANRVELYQCDSNIGPVQLRRVFEGREVIVVPDADPGTAFSLRIVTAGTGAYAFRLHDSCQPEDEEGSSVSAQSRGGTCGAYGKASVGGGIVGEDFIALDAASDRILTVRFTCVAPD